MCPFGESVRLPDSFIYKMFMLDKMTCLFFVLLGLHLRHMEVPSAGVELELQLPAYTTATAVQDSATYTTAHCNAGSLTH